MADIDTDDADASAAGIHKAPVTALINAMPGMQAGGALADPEVQAAEDRAGEQEEKRALQQQRTLTRDEVAAQSV